ncbi:N-acetylglucosamine-6-phosphate deacetylase [Caldicellulosiruptor saccharolyticus DSM 8903]|uniref:N-acetylglucosamine-6-phosphate deacetylase n=1 Tax=Caldicellulosiruptor saccharolyticus (strain ATCC 43494 / DSM 8903 / Tp8T 6331) TaxID=351627 RepID=A4XMH6_CALS8|nr:N-acetylglucosamine-6-phosphate deacetylase [Caldicellulosiruptor saccharolyticus]ABP68111.1 N-acetylglucosamine-6-phosphate deacetylase [Caldicellulosiruptor saccharolyticus DSM 8903]
MRKKFLVKKIFNGHSFIKDNVLVVEDGKILGTQKGIDTGKDEIIDRRDFILSPGFVDKHTHGIGGVDFFDTTENDLKTIQNYYFKHGVTTILPTIVSAPFENIYRLAKTIKEAKKDPNFKLNIPGIFSEGPFINPAKKGAHDERFLQRPTAEKLEELISNCEEKILDIALAPELLENPVEFFSKAAKKGINISLGHTNSSFDEAAQAHMLGAKNIIHLFNAMPQLHHRQNSITTYALLSDIKVEIICDLIHLSPEIVKLTYKLKGAENIILISDSIAATDLCDGEYSLGSLRVKVENGICRLTDGTIAGSTLTIDKAIKNLVKIGIKLEDALMAATYNPSKLFSLKCGAIKEGFSADFILMDENLNVKEVYAKGELVYKA